MPLPVSVDILDRMRPNLVSLVAERARRLPGLRHCDLRFEVREQKVAVSVKRFYVAVISRRG